MWFRKRGFGIIQYFLEVEIMKRIICMLVVMAAVATAAKAWTIDGPSVGTGGWNAIWNGPMSWDVWDDQVSGGVGAWWFNPPDADTILMPGEINGCEPMKWWVRPKVATNPKAGGNRYLYAPDTGAGTEWGVMFVDPAVSGQPADRAVIASVISKDQLLVQHDWGYQYYRPDVYSWENKPYFKTDARFTAINGEGAFLRIKDYAYAPNGAWDTAEKTLISYTDIALGDDWVWQVIHHNTVAKPSAAMAPFGVAINSWLLFELEIIGGNEDTRVFIDEMDFFSDQLYDPVVYPDAAASVPGSPEPATMSILALGGLLLRRKK
jgi:hypothetical protein